MIYTARELAFLCRNETMIEEDGEAKFVCSECLGEGVVEIMGDGDNFEWDVVGYKDCSKCNDN